MMSQIPDWFSTLIRDGIASMYAMSFPGAPSSEMLPATAKIWAADIWADPRVEWSRDADQQRIALAFQAIRRRLDRWPQQRDFWELLPSRPAPDMPALPKRAYTDAERESNLRRLSELIKGLH